MLPFKNWVRNEGDPVLNHQQWQHCSGFTVQLHWAAFEMSPQLSAYCSTWQKELGQCSLLVPLPYVTELYLIHNLLLLNQGLQAVLEPVCLLGCDVYMPNASFGPAQQGTSPRCSESAAVHFSSSSLFFFTYFINLRSPYTNNPVNAVRLWVEDYKQLQWFEFLCHL